MLAHSLDRMSPEPELHSARVWDLPTRAFHWLLAATVVASIVSAKIGGNAMAWHMRFGLLAMALLLFRLAWGFVGGHWSRFTTFVYGPRQVIEYLRGASGPAGRYDIGHSPLGSLSVFALIACSSARSPPVWSPTTRSPPSGRSTASSSRRSR
jgi:cytochrome b